MSIQLSTAVRNARLDAIETAIGLAAILKIRSGAPPATPATADSGTVLATLALPSDWMGAAANGSKGLSGVWQDAAADASGTAAHFRIYDSGGTVCHLQGTCAASAADMILDSINFTAGQVFTITSFTLTDGNP